MDRPSRRAGREGAGGGALIDMARPTDYARSAINSAVIGGAEEGAASPAARGRQTGKLPGYGEF